MSIFDTTALTIAGINNNSSTGTAVKARSQIFELTQAAEDAVIQPKDCGRLSHELRAWLAARIAKKAGHSELALHYMQMADPKASSDHPGHETHLDLRTLTDFVDKVANIPSDIEENDVADMKVAGFADQDIVRVCQLVAFIAYQVRITTGMHMMKDGAV